MRPTSSDEAVAQTATRLLAERGRPDLSITAAKVLYWRQRKRSAVPVASDRRAGRGRQTQYGAGAGEVVAALALALDADRRYAPAILAAFGDLASRGHAGAMAEAAVRECFDVFLRETEARAVQAVARRRSPEPIPRSERVSLPFTRRDPEGTATDAFLAVMLGDEPRHGEPDLRALENALAPGVAPLPKARRDELVGISSALRALGLAALRRVALNVNLNELAQLCRDVDVLMTAGEQMQRLFLVTGAKRSKVAYGSPQAEHAATMMQAMQDLASWFRGPRGLVLTMAALGVYARCLTPGSKRNFRESVEQISQALPGFTAWVDWLGTLPPEWRATAAPVRGNVAFASLPSEEQDALIEALGEWVCQHPDHAAQVDADFAHLLAGATNTT